MSQRRLIWDESCAVCGFPRFFQNWSDFVTLISSTQKPADLGHHWRCQWYCWVDCEWKRWAYSAGSQKQPKIQNPLRSALLGTADAGITLMICKSDLVWGGRLVWCARFCMLAKKFWDGQKTGLLTHSGWGKKGNEEENGKYCRMLNLFKPLIQGWLWWHWIDG